MGIDLRFLRRIVAVSAALFLSTLLASCGSGVTRSAYTRGVDLQEDGDLHGAVAAYEDALREQPQNMKAHYNLAFVCHDLFVRSRAANKSDESAAWRAKAEDHYGQVLAIEPGNARAIAGIAWLKVDSGDDAGARDFLAAQNPNDDEDRMILLCAKAALERRTGADEAAYATLKGALEADPVNLDATCAFVAVCEVTDRRAEAEAQVTKALEVHRFDLGLRLQHADLALADALGGGGTEFAAARWGDASTRYEAARVLDDRHWRVHYGLALVAKHEGRVRDAVRHFWFVQEYASDLAIERHGADPAEVRRFVEAELVGLYPALAQPKGPSHAQ